MPRLTREALLNRPLVPALLGLAVAAGIVVLYVILSGPVQPLEEIPPSLVRLSPLHKPVPAPDVAFADALGHMHTLKDFRGRYVLVNLWATWCTPCVKELPQLAALDSALPARRLAVLAINVGRGEAGATAAFLAARKSSALGVWRDPNIALERAFKAYGLPTSVLVDPKGVEIARAVGPADWGAPDAVAWFEVLTAPPHKAE